MGLYYIHASTYPYIPGLTDLQEKLSKLKISIFRSFIHSFHNFFIHFLFLSFMDIPKVKPFVALQ